MRFKKKKNCTAMENKKSLMSLFLFFVSGLMWKAGVVVALLGRCCYTSCNTLGNQEYFAKHRYYHDRTKVQRALDSLSFFLKALFVSSFL